MRNLKLGKLALLIWDSILLCMFLNKQTILVLLDYLGDGITSETINFEHLISCTYTFIIHLARVYRFL